MKNIIVDVKMHFPMLCKCVENCDYFSSERTGYLSKERFSSMYSRDYCDFYNEQNLLDESYNNFYLIHHFVDINTPQTRWMDANQLHHLSENGDGMEVKVIKEIYDLIKPRVKGKIIFLCTSDHPRLDLDADGEYSFVRKYGFEYDTLFKKEYNKNAQYSDKTFPCPFFVMGSPDVLWMLNESQIDNQDRDDRIFWSGFSEGTEYDYQLVKISRNYYINSFNKIFVYNYSGSDRGGLRDNNYLIEMSRHKYAIYLAGWATFTRRFFEIMSTNTLLFYENTGIVFNLDEFLHPLCVFNNLDELKSNYETINSSEELYNECIEVQKNFVRKYYNYQFISEYISSRVGVKNMEGAQ